MSAFLRLGEAARQLGVSVDTVRRYVEEGRLPSFRTPGGQTQIRADDVTALRGLGAVPRKPPREPVEEDWEVPATPEQVPLRREPEPRRPAWQDLPPWEQRRAEMRTDLEIEGLQHERDRLEGEAERRAAADAAAAAEDERLRALKRYGKHWCWELKLERQVIRELEGFVTTDAVPRWLTEAEQKGIVQRFVMDLITAHQEKERAEKERRAAEETRRMLGHLRRRSR